MNKLQIGFPRVPDKFFQIPPDLLVKLNSLILLRLFCDEAYDQMSCRNGRSKSELPSTSEAHLSTTKSECAVKAQWRNVARPERMQVRSEPLELSCADHSAR